MKKIITVQTQMKLIGDAVEKYNEYEMKDAAAVYALPTIRKHADIKTEKIEGIYGAELKIRSSINLLTKGDHVCKSEEVMKFLEKAECDFNDSIEVLLGTVDYILDKKSKENFSKEEIEKYENMVMYLKGFLEGVSGRMK
ncbi:hypothetical protein RAK27_11965 [Carnobacterium maltaromaticum]|uniref:Phage protein n=1 Tax=Carnobacterium maltaromaticum TaxID=2751 RepID=A0AAW9JRK3_CARML|nr:hypothetical protein [Carnobacterium maltaromaticum]MDZ5759380.1 hypothetical protein [Carnobacterium maltaromaticum]